jgi:hypothetical protein
MSAAHYAETIALAETAGKRIWVRNSDCRTAELLEETTFHPINLGESLVRGWTAETQWGHIWGHRVASFVEFSSPIHWLVDIFESVSAI